MTTAGETSLLRTIPRRDRVIGLAVLFLFAALAWWYLLAGAGMDMDAMGMPAMPEAAGGVGEMAREMARPQGWTARYGIVMFVMWWVMMIAMMLPSAAPMILLYGLMNRRQVEQGNPSVSAWVFALGYLAVWGAFSLLATLLQWRLEAVALMSPMMMTTSGVLGGLILIAAGLYQFTPLKDACLRHCRGPVEFLAAHWKPGAGGALAHGGRARCILPWLLLGTDGAALLWWGHEPVLDRRTDPLHAAGEAGLATGPTESRRWARLGGVGNRGARRRGGRSRMMASR